MDRFAIIAVVLIAFIVLYLRNLKSKTQEEKYEGIIAVYVVTCCFTRFFLPLYVYDEEQQYGSFGNSIMLWPYMLFILYLIWVVKVKQKGFITMPNKILVGAFLVFTIYNFTNPNNSVVGSSMIALFFLCTLLIFYYLLSNAFTAKTLVNGIYKGFAFTIILQAILCVCYPILGMKFVTDVFVSGAALRGEVGGRFETVGTFAHPNALGVYCSYIFMFFLGCVMGNYQRKKSWCFLALSIFATAMSGSRSALASSLVGTVVLITFYVFRKYHLLNPKIFFRGVLPVMVVGVILAAGPLRQLFEDSTNLNDMAVYRMMHYYCAFEIVQDNPLLGVGINGHLYSLLNNTSLVDFEAVFDTSEMWQPEEFMFHNPVHNIWLILLAELGIIGFLPILVFVIYYFASFKRRIRNSKNKYFHIVACTGMGIMCALLTQGNSDWNPLSQQQLIISLMFLAFSLNKRFMSDQYGDEMDILPPPPEKKYDDPQSA